MNALAARITAVNDIAEQLLKANPPGKGSIINTQKQLNHRWGEEEAADRMAPGEVPWGLEWRLKRRRESPLEYVGGGGDESGVRSSEEAGAWTGSRQGASRGYGWGAASLSGRSRW